MNKRRQGWTPSCVVADQAHRLTAWAGRSGRGLFCGMKFPPDYAGVLIWFQSGGDYRIAVFEASKRPIRACRLLGELFADSG